MRLGRLLLAVAFATAVASGFASTAAEGDTTLQEQILGVLVGVGPNQRSLIVEYFNANNSGCGIDGVTPTVVETERSVAVSLAAAEEVLPPGAGCAAAVVGTSSPLTVPLSAPLDGRAVTGLRVLGGALAPPGMAGVAGPSVPGLVGLSPLDARLILTPSPDVPGNQHPFAVIVRHTHHAGVGPLPRVISQRPAAGKPLHGQHMTVTLTVAP